MKPGCGYCGGPLFRGVCQVGHANRRERENRSGKIRPESKPAVSWYALEWRPVYFGAHGNPTRTAQWRRFVVASNGQERMLP